MTFSINVPDRAQAEHELASFGSDLALMSEPLHLFDFEVLYALPQPVHAVICSDSPMVLNQSLRLLDLMGQKLVMPFRAYSVRPLLDIGESGAA